MTTPLIEAVTRLADLLARENAALRIMDMPTVTGLIAEKAKALNDIGGMVDHALGPPPANRARATGLAARLLSLAAENRHLLEIALIAQGRVVSLVARIASKPYNEAANGYGMGGCPTQARPVAIALSARA